MLRANDTIRIVGVGAGRFMGEIVYDDGRASPLPYPSMRLELGERRGWPGLTRLEVVTAMFEAALVTPPRRVVLEHVAPSVGLPQDAEPRCYQVGWCREIWPAAQLSCARDGGSLADDRVAT